MTITGHARWATGFRLVSNPGGCKYGSVVGQIACQVPALAGRCRPTARPTTEKIRTGHLVPETKKTRYF